MKVVRRVRVLDGIRWTGDNFHEVKRWAEEFSCPLLRFPSVAGEGSLQIYTERGIAEVREGDWILTDGERFWPVEEEKFRELYQVVEGAAGGKA